MDKQIHYEFFHWGPLLYKTKLNKEEIQEIKSLCKKNKEKDCRETLVGLIENEYLIDSKLLFKVICPYLQSYSQVYLNYTGSALGGKITLIESWVNYMTKFESNPIHNHAEDLSFVIFTDVPKNLEQERKNTISKNKPGDLHFILRLADHKLEQNAHTFKPEVGDFFIFPASLNHWVNHFKSDGERISVSGNIKVE